MDTADDMCDWLRAAKEPLERAKRRVRRVREHSARGEELDGLVERLDGVIRDIEELARAEDGRICRRCLRYYEREDMEVEHVPRWGADILTCPHCGSHKMRIKEGT